VDGGEEVALTWKKDERELKWRELARFVCLAGGELCLTSLQTFYKSLGSCVCFLK